MAIPGYEAMMLPLLELLQDGKEHEKSEIIEGLSNYFNLSEEEKNERRHNKAQTILSNRTEWAKTYLKNAVLIANPKRGVICITPRGLEVLNSKPKELTKKYLEKFPEYQEWSKSSGDKTPIVDDGSKHIVKTNSQTPDDILEASYKTLRATLAQELLEKVKKCKPSFFENLVVDLLLAMGYGGSREEAGHVIGKVGDGGIDGVIHEDKLGLDVVYIQAKRWEGTVGSPTVMGFAGSLDHVHAKKGIILTTSQFSQDAIEYVTKIEKKIVLVDGKKLAQLMIDFDIGVTETSRYVIKNIDSDYFEEG